MVRSTLAVPEFGHHEFGVSLRSMKIYYVAESSGKIYDCSKQAPHACYNCKVRHFRFVCEYAVGSDNEQEFRSTQRRLTPNSPVIPLGKGFVLCLDRAQANRWLARQYGRIANANAPPCPDFIDWLDALVASTPSGNETVDALASLLGNVNVGTDSNEELQEHEGGNQNVPDLDSTLDDEESTISSEE